MCAEATADFLRYFNIVFFFDKIRMHGSKWMEWIAGNPRPMSSCGPFALGSLSFWTRCNHPHRRLPFRGVSCDLGGFQIWLCTKTSPPKQVVYHHFAFSNGLLEGSQFSDTHTPYLSYMLHTYDCLWLSIDVCTSVQYMCDLVYACLDLAPACKTTKPLLKLVCEFGLPNFNPQEQQQKWSKD